MNRFFLALWGRWMGMSALIALGVAIGFASIMTIVFYALKGFAPLDVQTWEALRIIWYFWLKIGYGVGVLAGLVGGLKFICKIGRASCRERV